MFENMEVLGWFPWPRPWPVRWAHPTQPPWPDHRRCGPRCGSLLHPLDDKKAILIIPCHLLSMFPFVLHWFTMFYPILAPCPSHALYPCHSSTLEAPKSVASHDVTRYELPQVPWVPAKFPPGSHRLPGQDIFQGREIPPHDANVENEQRSHQQQQRKVHDPRGCWMVRVVPMAACIKAANIINNALIWYPKAVGSVGVPGFQPSRVQSGASKQLHDWHDYHHTILKQG